MLSKSLEQSLHHSLALANSKNHEFATLEHLLLALTEDEDAADLMRACGVDLDRLHQALEKFIDEELSDLVTDRDEVEAKATAGFQRVIQRAVHHVQMSGRGEATGANTIVAIFSERESHAVYFLEEQGMTRLDAVSYISHGISKVPGSDRASVPGDADNAGDDDKSVKQGQSALEAYCVDLNEKARNGKVDPLIPIKQALDDLDVISFDKHPRFNGGAVGYLSYDAVNYFEKLPVAMDDPLNLPESVFMLNTTFLIFDHIRNKIRLVSHVNLDGNIQSEYVVACKRIDELISRLKSDLEPSGSQKPINIDSIKSNMSHQEHEKSVNKIIKYIYEGDCIQVVLSQRFSRKTDVSPLDIYCALREINPSPYMFYLELDGFQILGSSPEMLVRNQNGHLDYHPIAGTRPRGSTPEQDLELGTELQNDEKVSLPCETCYVAYE